MAGALLPVLAIGGAGIGMATSAAGARAQNRAIRRAQDEQNRAAGIQMEQVRDQAALEREKRLREARAIEARLRVVAADGGALNSGSYDALARQIDLDTLRNVDALNRNEQMAYRRIQSGATATNLELANRYTNPLLSAFTGGLSGFSTGLEIGRAGMQIGSYFNPWSPPTITNPPSPFSDRRGY